MHRIIELSLTYRFLIVVLTLLVIGVGVHNLQRLTIDAVPDITPVQVQILTKAPALGPVEVEQFITYPIEAAMSGLPDLQEIRSVSRYGLSAVTVIFEESVNRYFARQLVNERLQQAVEQIPPQYGRPEMGPLTTGLGEVYHFTVEGDGYSPMELRTILDWQIAFRLRSVPGVVEVNAWGGLAKQYHVVIDPQKLVAYRIPLSKVFEALERNNANAGSGYIEHNQEQYIIRGEALVRNMHDVENVVVDVGADGTPVYVRQLGQVREGAMLRIGAATAHGTGETVIGMVQMLAGENANQVVERVKQKIEQIKPSLPPGVRIVPFYDRADFVSRVIRTVRNNLVEGALLVIAVLFLFLGNVRAGLIVASVIPLSMLMAFTGMRTAHVSANLMSLGAIDFGLIVDAAVIVVENCMRRLAERAQALGRMLTPTERIEVIRNACVEVRRASQFGEMIIIAAYIPILSLVGIEGKMFKPMAYTVVFALIGALILAMTLMPVLVSFFMTRQVSEKETFLMRAMRHVYAPTLQRVISHPRITVAVAVATFLTSLALVPWLGREFIPRLDEGDITLHAWRLPSVALSESVASTMRIERVLSQFPEVIKVVSRTGSPEVATDVMGIELSDVFVILKPRSQWTTAGTKEELIEKMNEALARQVPGSGFGFTQPIEMRFNELIAGVRSDIAVKVFGEDLDVLKAKADEIVRVLSRVPGAADVKAEQIAGLPMIRIVVDRERIARYGINAADVLDVIQAARVGKVVSTIFEGQRRFDLIVRLPEAVAADTQALANIPVADSQGRLIPLAQLADIRLNSGPAQVSREDIQRRIVVECNVRGRDLGSFIAEAQQRIGNQVSLPAGYYLEWGGQFENLQRATQRLAVIVPLTLLVIFVILYMAFGSVRLALLIYLNVPMALTGGIFALMVRGMPFSISAGIGFIALFGVAVLNGIVMVTFISQLREQGLSLDDAIVQGALARLRPVLMTALVASLGFAPMALSTSAGAEVQRPLATVVIGGLITSTLLTLLVLPTIYRWFEKKQVG
ncbi:MAG: CusA/CzcA family heavy metal efflux RND transporter [Acidobacteriota bacterium]|nr:CusA/CzcA family heavy metal efflux RND transporter [Blastocatellia bacterium]MDW8239752.1 CusA/CzcA family heavy metal efflux RND transporter [Acidobacteriota bacterium]